MHLGNIDIVIFVGFLVINLAVGLFYGRGVKTIKDYALGGRSFSTGTIAATLVATWIGGGFFAWNLSKAYSDGLPFITAVIGNGLAVLILGYFYSARVGEFLGCNSVAEVMGNLFGKKVRMITSIAAMCLAIGYAGLQIKVLSNLINWSLGIDGKYAAISATTVVIVYSTFGGIRSVTFTDVIQFLTFGAFVPALALLIWGSFDSPEVIITAIHNNPQLFDYHSLFTFSWLALFLWMACPDLDPAMFQRVLIAKNVAQVRKSFIIASAGCIAIICITSWVGLLIFAKNPNLNPDQIITYIIGNYSYTGLKGFTMIGITAMVMSTVDSYINSASVIFANDLCPSVGMEIKNQNQRLFFSRCFAVFMGLAALVVSLSYDDIFELTLITTNFYMPIVTIPLTLAIFGFRSTSKSVLIGMSAGAIAVILWKNYCSETGIDSVIPAMISNLVFLVTSHYLLRQEGGFIGIKDKEPLRIIRSERKRKWQNFIKSIKEFNFITFCRKNSPKEDYVYSYFGLFSIISVFSTIYTLPQNIQHQNQEILSIIYHTVLVTSTSFLTYPIWPQTFKNKTFISIFWNIAIFYILVCVSAIFIIISNFGQFQLMMLVLNIFVLSSLVRWQITLIGVPLVCWATIKLYKCCLGVSILTGSIGDLQFKIVYLLLLISSVLIGFVKPKQEQQELTEEKNKHLSGRIEEKDQEAQEALALKGEFIRNVNHEYHAPMTGVISIAETLQGAYDKLTDEQKKNAIDTIVTSAHSLKALDDNIATLARLNRPHYELKKEEIDFGSLVMTRVQICRKLYEENVEDREFILDIEEGIKVNVDKSYMIQLLDNLIINSIKYCKKGKINILLNKDKDEVQFSISDEGIGIPVAELFDIFKPFTVGSRTKTPAVVVEGVGLAICERIVEVHGGSIKAESNGGKGAIFRVMLLN